MLKRILPILLVLVFLLSLAPAASSYSMEGEERGPDQVHGNEPDLFSSNDAQRQQRLAVMEKAYDPSRSDPAPLHHQALATSSPEGDEIVYLVRFRDDCSFDRIEELLQGEAFTLIGPSDRRLVSLTSGDIGAFKEKAKGSYLWVEEDRPVKAQLTANDPMVPDQWALGQLKINKAWDRAIGSVDVMVAVLDPGFERSHEDFIRGDIRLGWDYIRRESVKTDPRGHGTMVTGVISAAVNNKRGIAGLCWRSTIIPYRVLDSRGEGKTSDAVEAVYDAVDLGCKIINMSYGSRAYSASENEAVQYAHSKGVIVIASAGNEGRREHFYPASYEGVISVGATTRGQEISCFSTINDQVTVTAPGEEILTTSSTGGYAWVEGTSISAPQVTGLAALALSLRPGLTREAFIEALTASAVDLGPPGLDIYYGHGLVDANRLLSRLDFSFKDVKKDAWYYDYVLYLARRKILNGYPDKTFRPAKGVRRDHASKMISLAAGLDHRGKRASFPDLSPEDEMSPFIAALVEVGAIGGFPGGEFRPKNLITREQVCIITAKAFDLSMGDLPSSFKDMPSHEGTSRAIRILASNGIVKGLGGTKRFDPKGQVTRAQMTKILAIAMAVSAIQEAEAGGKQGKIDRAQALVDYLPRGQDKETRTYLQGRIDRIESP